MAIGETAKLTAFIGADKESNDIEWHSSDTSVATVDSDGTVTGCGMGSAVISATCSFGTAECQINVSLIGSICSIDGIRYKIKSKNTCMVALPENGKRYDQEIINIPSQIEAFGNKFVVDELEWSGFVGVFYRCPNLVEVTLPNTISHIPGDTFEYCEKLTTVNLPSSIDFIDAFAFCGCSSLSHIDLKEGLTGLWTWNFAWCPNLKDIELPASLKNMGREIFYGNTHLDRIHCKSIVPPSVQGDFFNIEELSEDYHTCALVVPEESLEAYKKAEYWRNFDIIVPDYVILNKYRLKLNPDNLYQLRVVNCDESEVVWRSGNEEVAKVDSDGNVTAVGEGETIIQAEYNGKFAECKITVSLQGLCTEIDGIYYKITGSNTCAVTRPESGEGYQMKSVTIPSNIEFEGNNYVVTTLEHDAFADCWILTEIHLPNTLLEVPSTAFSGCGIYEITIPVSVKRLGEQAFSICSNLSKVHLNEGIQEMGYRAFAVCHNLKEFVLPESLEKMTREIFFNTPLEKIYSKAIVPPTLDGDLFNDGEDHSNCALIVPDLSVDAYKKAEYWKNFKTILSENDLILNSYQISLNPNDTYQLSSINYPDRPIEWKSENEAIASVDANGNVTAKSVGETIISAQYEGKIAECKIKVTMQGLSVIVEGIEYLITSDDTCELISREDEHKELNENVVIPSHVGLLGDEYAVTSIGMSAFYRDPLKTIDLPNTVEVIKVTAFDCCEQLERIELPNSITSIHDAAFSNCHKLSEIKLSENLTSIGTLAFAGCYSLEAITIPASVSLIEFCIFNEVPLKKLIMQPLTPPLIMWYDGLFENVDSPQYGDCVLIVPEASYDLYRDHWIYGRFSNIQVEDSGVESIDGEKNLCKVYTLSGVLVAENVSDDRVSDIVPSGLYILRFNDGSVKKVMF